MAVSRLHPSPPPPTQHQHQQHHHHHIASTLMSCVRESSPVEELEEAAEDPSECGAGGAAESRKQGRHESKKRRFHPLRELRRIFRIKSRRSPEDGDRDVIPQSSTVASSYGPNALTRDEGRDSGGAAAAYGDLDEAYRSRSASELLSGEEDEDEEESPGGRRRGSGGIASGDLFQDSLRHSVSHDSVFSSGERRVSSGGGGGGGSGGRPILPLAPSSSAQQVAAHQGVRAELFDAVRRRRWRSRSKDRDEDNDADRETGEAAAANPSSDDEEDLGLPRSPCNSPSSGEAGLRSDQKEIQSKSHSTCSEGSLVSMGSSDMDEDSQGHFSGHSSKLSLQERSSSQYGSDFELDVGATAEPLSHSAARHKMSVRPKRTHGAPRPRRLKEVTSLGSLPTTPEVNEDSGRCSSPEVSFNQETSSSEHIQVPSDCQAKNVPMSSAIDMPQRHPQSRQVAASPKSDLPHSCLPDNFEPTATEASATLAPELLMSGDKELKETGVDVTKQESGRVISEFSESNHGGVEEEMEESEGGSTTLLSRILSWRGSKKKIEEHQEASFAAPAEGTPARRMDVHGRYVHEVICETEVTSPGLDQPPPSPAWRSPFATSWPPLHHSTPRSCHSSTRYIPPGRGDDQLDNSTSPDWGSGLSGPHSLPLMMQFESMEKCVTDGRFLESHTPPDLSSSSKTRMPSEMDDFGFNSSSFNAFKAQGSTILSSSDAPESLPVSFNRASFEPEHSIPASDKLVKVSTKDVCPVEKGSPQRETFLMTSVEGLLTLDLSRPSEVNMHDTSEEESSGNFEVDNNVPEVQEEWEEPPKVTEESLHFNSCISVPDEGNAFSEENSEPKVMLHHTRLERNAEELHCQRSEESLKIDGTQEVSFDRVNDQQDQQPNLTKTTPPNSQRYKRTQSLPLGTTLTQPPDVPEFLRVQLIHVDSRPTTNVVLHSAGGVPVSVNPPEVLETPGRRRMRPRSADSLDSNQPGSKESDPIPPAGNTRFADNVLTIDNDSDSGSIKEKEVPKEGKCKISTWEPASKINQIDDIKTKEMALPCLQQKKMHEEIPDKIVNVPVTSTKEKVEFTDIFQKALLRDCSEINILSDDAKLKDNSTPVRAQHKTSGDSVTKTGVAITSMKDREEGKFKAPSKEPLGTAAVDNKIRDASLPPKAQRKISEDSTTEVVTRRKSTSKDLTSQNKDEEPELFKVFARRSLKLKDSEAWENHPPGQQQKSRDSDKENEVGENVMDVMILPTNKEQKHRDSVGKGEFLKEIDPQGKSFVSDGTPQLQKMPSSNGLLPSSSISSLQSVFSGEKVVDNPKTHRSSIGGSLPRREGPSPEKRPRGISLNLPPESHPFRGAIVTGEQQRRPLWATQIQPDESYGRTAEVANQTIDLGFRAEEEVKPHFKGIQQRKEEWELRARMQ